MKNWGMFMRAGKMFGIVVLWAAGLVSGTSARAEPPATFNLVCEGKETFIEGQAFAAHITSESAASDTFRVDMKSRRWCNGSCASTSPIAEAGDTTITLKKVVTDPDIPLDEEIIVHRETGRMLARWRTGGLTRMRDEQCVRAPFTGFPERLF